MLNVTSETQRKEWFELLVSAAAAAAAAPATLSVPPAAPAPATRSGETPWQ